MSWGETIFLKKVIDGKKSFRASKNPLVIFSDTRTRHINGNTIGTFKAKTKGQINLVVVVPSYNGFNGRINIRKNGIETNHLNILNIPEESVIELSLNAEKGDIYQFEVGTTFEANMIYIGADIVDGSLFDYTIGG